jgi:hypothetical protein
MGGPPEARARHLSRQLAPGGKSVDFTGYWQRHIDG